VAGELLNPKPASRIPCLDGLRGISILLVLDGHLGIGLSGRTWLKFPLLVFGHSSLGVSIFFVVSGFLITNLLLAELDRCGKISLPGFYFRRAMRILPAYYVYIVAILSLWGLGSIQLGWKYITGAALFVWNYYPAVGVWWLGHTWTLSVEEQFYLCWPVILSLAGRKKASYLAALLVVFAPVLRLVCHLVWPGYIRGRVPVALPTRIDSLMYGCLLALLWDTPIFNRFCKKIFNAGGHWYAVVFLFLASPILDNLFHGAYSVPFGYTLEGISIALMCAWVIQNSESLPGRFLQARLLVHIGVISYSLYLWQQLFTGSEAGPPLLSFPWNLIALVAVAELSYHLIERKFLRLRSRIIDSRRRRIGVQGSPSAANFPLAVVSNETST
jgi:peptidoglycan/LPS O-acetylase OafA/YrhL